MKILITGVTSFIGRALARRLISEGTETFGVVRPDSKNKDGLPEMLNVIECDLSDSHKLSTLLPDTIDACIHLGWDGIGRCGRMDHAVQSVNIANTLSLIPVLKELGCRRLIFAGSQAEYGIVTKKITEETVCNPVSEYGKAKLAVLDKAFKLCNENEITYIHARIFSVYGAGDHATSLVDSCIRAFMEGKHIDLGPCEQTWNYLYVDDCAKALSDLATCVYMTEDGEDTSEAIVNIASAESMQLRDYVERIKNVIGQGSFSFTDRQEPAEGTPNLNPCIDRLIDMTGFSESLTFEEGIKKIEEMYSMR